MIFDGREICEHRSQCMLSTCRRRVLCVIWLLSNQIKNWTWMMLILQQNYDKKILFMEHLKLQILLQHGQELPKAYLTISKPRKLES